MREVGTPEGMNFQLQCIIIACKVFFYAGSDTDEPQQVVVTTGRLYCYPSNVALNLVRPFFVQAPGKKTVRKLW